MKIANIKRYAAGAFLTVGLINGIEALDSTKEDKVTPTTVEASDQTVEYLGNMALSLVAAGYLAITATRDERFEDQISQILTENDSDPHN